MVAAEEVLIVSHSFRRGLVDLQSTWKPSEERAESHIELSVRQWHTDTLSCSTSERNHVVI